MANDARKQAFTRAVIKKMRDLINVTDDISNLDSEFFDNGYDAIGSDPIIDADVAAYTITAVQFISVITLMQQLNNFLENTPVTTADYSATLNAVRRSLGV